MILIDMKKYRKYLIVLVVILVIFVSYKPLLLWYFDVQEPKVESQESLKEYLKSNQWDFGENIYTFKDAISLKKFYKINHSLPDVKFFNSRGAFIDYRKTPKSCNAGVNVLLNDLGQLQNKTDSKINIENALANIVDDSGRQPLYEKNKYDYYIILYWARYIGKLNKTKVFDWKQHIDNINKNNDTKIKMYFVNCDEQMFWSK